MDGLIRLVEENGACLLMVRHLNKAGGGRSIYRGLGSIDFTGAARTEMFAGSVPGEPNSRVMAQGKNNLGPLCRSLGYEIVGSGTEARLEWQGYSSVTADQLLEVDPGGTATQSNLKQAMNFLRRQLAGGPKAQKQLVADSGFSERTLQRAIRDLGGKKYRDGEGGAWIWAMDQAYPPANDVPANIVS